jgi:AcrR family transcriptional regulator
MQAARVVLERDGYLDARVADIVAEAGVGHGTFYTYFGSKEEVFDALIRDVMQQMYDAATVPLNTSSDPVERIQVANRRYLRSYRQHAAIVGVLEQVATFNPQFRSLRRSIRQVFQERSERGLRRLQAEGLADPGLSARCAAEALTSMVSNFAYMWLVLGEEFDEEEAVSTLTTIWARGIGLSVDRAG